MLGAMAGDFIGSVYEHHRIRSVAFPLLDERCRFTDDSVMTVAVAAAILEHGDYAGWMRHFGRLYPHAGYGSAFAGWIFAPEPKPYNSWGNGAAMRVSPVGFAFNTLEEVLLEAKKSAEVSHDHPEGIKGAQATALAVFLAWHGAGKDELRKQISARFGYDLARTIEEIRPDYQFDVSCQGTVPPAITAFLDSRDYEHAVRLAISLGGDSDTLACIAGAIAQAHYKTIPEALVTHLRGQLPDPLLSVVDRFWERYGDEATPGDRPTGAG